MKPQDEAYITVSTVSLFLAQEMMSIVREPIQ